MSQVSQRCLIREMLQSLDFICGPSKDSLCYVHVSHVLATSELNTLLQVLPPSCGIKGKHHLPQPAGNAVPKAAQDTICLLCSKGALLAHVQPGFHQDLQVLFCEAAFQMCVFQHTSVHQVVLPHVQEFTLPLVGLREIPFGPFLQPVEGLLEGSTTLRHISQSSQFDVVCKLAESTLCPIIQTFNEDVEQDWTQYLSLGHTTSHWPPTRLRAADQHHLGQAIQPDFNVCSSSPHINSFFTRMLWEAVSKTFLKSREKTSTATLASTKPLTSSYRFIKFVKCNLPLGKSC